jgi:hypothetical protein
MTRLEVDTTAFFLREVMNMAFSRQMIGEIGAWLPRQLADSLIELPCRGRLKWRKSTTN